MLNRAEHEKNLSLILAEIYGDAALKTKLGFKGGTACYFLYNLPRFSVDLDFNLVQTTSSEATRAIFTRVSDILLNYGNTKQAQMKRHTLFWLLSYSPGSQAIKIEVSTRFFSGDQYEVKHFLGWPLLVMRQPFITAHKLAAILDRPRLANRDLFDAHFMLKSRWPIDADTIRTRVGKPLNQYLRDLIVYLETSPPQNPLHGLGELLNSSQKEWVKTSLISELLFLLRTELHALRSSPV